jgi:hypothetical protein
MSVKTGVYGKLTIVKEVSPAVFLCKCACGNEVTVWRSLLVKDIKTNCGCTPSNSTYAYHGHVRCSWTREGRSIRRWSSEYLSYQSMKTRCLNEKQLQYCDYGGRGIRICERWLLPKCAGFKNFIDDLGPRPSGKTLDRIDPQGHYEPGNCRWADGETQGRNQRRYLYPDGNEPPVEKYSEMEKRLEEELGVPF